MNNKNGTDRLLIYIMEKSDIEELRIFHNEDISNLQIEYATLIGQYSNALD